MLEQSNNPYITLIVMLFFKQIMLFYFIITIILIIVQMTKIIKEKQTKSKLKRTIIKLIIFLIELLIIYITYNLSQRNKNTFFTSLYNFLIIIYPYTLIPWKKILNNLSKK